MGFCWVTVEWKSWGFDLIGRWLVVGSISWRNWDMWRKAHQSFVNGHYNSTMPFMVPLFNFSVRHWWWCTHKNNFSWISFPSWSKRSKFSWVRVSLNVPCIWIQYDMNVFSKFVICSRRVRSNVIKHWTPTLLNFHTKT